MTPNKVTLTYDLTPQLVSDILDNASDYFGYWVESYTRKAGDPSTEMTLTVEDKEYLVNEEAIAKGLQKLFSPGFVVDPAIVRDMVQELQDPDYAGTMDGYDADVVVQLACFGEIVYG